jgi:hypothetical protein
MDARNQREIAGLVRELKARVRERELQRQHGATPRELERRRAQIARIRWRLARAVQESAQVGGSEAA